MESTIDAPIVGPIPLMRYARNFLSEQQQASLLEKITMSKTWVQLKNRRLQEWGGKPTASGMVGAPLPSWLGSIGQTLVASKCLSSLPNHVLINEYLPGQGIMAHEDGPLYLENFVIIS